MSFSDRLKQLYILVVVGSSGILKGKQKLGVTFNFDKKDVNDLIKFSKMTICNMQGPQKQIQKNSHRSFVFWAKNYKGLLFYHAKGNLIVK